MNRLQKKAKILNATRHKDKCKWLKGGVPRKYRKMRGLMVKHGIRMSRRKLHDMSIRTMNAYMKKAEEIQLGKFIDL